MASVFFNRGFPLNAFYTKRLSFIFMVVWKHQRLHSLSCISDVNPIRERFAELARLGGFAPGDLEKIVEAYNKAFGLDKSLWVQYYDYMVGFYVRLWCFAQ